MSKIKKNYKTCYSNIFLTKTILLNNTIHHIIKLSNNLRAFVITL